jgi:hypothetical protein
MLINHDAPDALDVKCLGAWLCALIERGAITKARAYRVHGYVDRMRFGVSHKRLSDVIEYLDLIERKADNGL